MTLKESYHEKNQSDNLPSNPCLGKVRVNLNKWMYFENYFTSQKQFSVLNLMPFGYFFKNVTDNGLSNGQ